MDASSSGRRDLATERMFAMLCLVFFLISAGCSAGLTGQTGQREPVGLNITNAANTTHTFEVFVVEGSQTEVTIKKKDDPDDSASPDAGLSSYNFTKDYGNVTSVKFPSRHRLHGRYILAPGETSLSNISDLPKNFRVMVVVYYKNRVTSLVSATCDSDFVYLGVTMRYYGSDNVYDCG